METSIAPNQQIVVAFADMDISEKDTHSTIEAIKLKLENIGVEQIMIGQHQDGELKITYYSDAAVEHIKNILSGEEDFKLSHYSNSSGSNDLPEQKQLKNYKLNISEIQKKSNSDWDFDGFYITEFNSKTDRFNNLKLEFAGTTINSSIKSKQISIATKSNTSKALAVGIVLYKVPEVRAGPLS